MLVIRLYTALCLINQVLFSNIFKMFLWLDSAQSIPYGTGKVMPIDQSEVKERDDVYMPHEAAIQISLRLPRATLAKLTRLAQLSVQTKSQYVTKLLQRIPDKYLEKPSRKLPSHVLDEILSDWH
jgi:hypothetical protein